MIQCSSCDLDDYLVLFRLWFGKLDMLERVVYLAGLALNLADGNGLWHSEWSKGDEIEQKYALTVLKMILGECAFI